MLRFVRKWWLTAFVIGSLGAASACCFAYAQTPPVDSTGALPDLSGVVTVTGDGKVTVNVGLFGSQLIAWLFTAFGGTIAAAVVAWLIQLARKMGVQMTETLRKRFEDIVLTGLSIGAAKAEEQLKGGETKIEIKNQAAAAAIEYVQKNGIKTAAKLGLDVNSAEAVEIIKAKIEKMVNDPAVATPASISPPKTATDTIRTEKTTLNESGDTSTTVTTTEAKPPI